MEGKSLAIKSLVECIDQAAETVANIKARGWIMKYLKAEDDKGDLEDSVDLLQTALYGL